MKFLFRKILNTHFAAFVLGLSIVISAISADMAGAGSSNELTDSVAASAGEEYTVREYDSRIGVFVTGETQPIQVVQVYVMYLPEADRALLREGITVKGHRELMRLIEDFTS